jgi:uncharacterized protein (DUF1501 family)
MNALTRRRFLEAAAASGLVYTFGGRLGGSYAQAATFSDYKALVCVFLLGGNDSWSMVVPTSTAEYNAYAASRQNLAIAADALLPLSPSNPLPATYGLHPSLASLKPLFDSGKCAFIANVGPLIVPTTRAQYVAGSVPLPPQLFSHNDQQNQWQSLRGRTQLKTGWAGRVADAFASQLGTQQLPMNVSLSGTSFMQAATSVKPYVMGPTGPAALTAFGASGAPLNRRNSYMKVANATYPSIYERIDADQSRRTIAYATAVTSALAAAPALGVTFPTSVLGQQLQTVAKLIAVRESLAATRQVFFITMGGFDTHDEQLANQPTLLGGVAASLAAFQSAVDGLGVGANVTTFTQSDFGRTLTSNGDGSDHAWGGLQLVLGGSVLGRRIYGSYPDLRIGAANDVGGGRFIPDVSSDQYVATLVRWFGVPEATIPTIAPSIGNFTSQDLGFLA